MAHKARVLTGAKTVKIHYANCNAYNADFDGDEINVHALQSETSRAEALMTMTAENMYVSAKDGSPLAGLIQDHMIAGFWICIGKDFHGKIIYLQNNTSAFTTICWRIEMLYGYT